MEMVAFPVFDARLEGLDRFAVLRLPVCLVGPISDSLRGGKTFLELLEIRIVISVECDLEKTLRGVKISGPDLQEQVTSSREAIAGTCRRARLA